METSGGRRRSPRGAIRGPVRIPSTAARRAVARVAVGQTWWYQLDADRLRACSRGRSHGSSARAMPIGLNSAGAKLGAHTRAEASVTSERAELVADKLCREKGERVEDAAEVAAGAVTALDAIE